MNVLYSTEVVASLNHLLIDVLRTEEEDPEGVLFIRTFLSRYISRGRPLSGYFIVCCVIEAQWTVLAQALAPESHDDKDVSDFVEAAAANKAWKALLHVPVEGLSKSSDGYKQALQMTLDSAMKCFTNLLAQIEDMEAEPSEDSYAWETMSESLVRTRNYAAQLIVADDSCRNSPLSAQRRRTRWTKHCSRAYSSC